MARIETITAENFREWLQGEYAFCLPSEHRFASTNYIASTESRIRDGEPNVEPIPWEIPSAQYYDYSGSNGEIARQNMPVELRSKPDYAIVSETGFLSIGGNYTFNSELRKNIVFYKEFPCSIVIRDCTFQVSLTFEYIKSKHYIKFENCVFEKHVGFKDTNLTGLSFTNCTFKYLHTEFNDSNIKNIYLIDCILDKVHFYSNKDTFFEYVTLKNATANELNFHGEKQGVIYLMDFNCNNINTVISKPCSNDIANEIKKMHFNGLCFVFSESLNTNLTLSRFSTNLLQLDGKLANSSIIFREGNVDNFIINSLTNNGILKFQDILLENNGIGGIMYSHLGNTEFNYVNFLHASRFSFYLSNINDVLLINTDFPDTIAGKDENDINGIRDIYRQLKNLSDRQGDTIRSKRYEELELITDAKIMKEKTKDKFKKFKIYKEMLEQTSSDEKIIWTYLKALYDEQEEVGIYYVLPESLINDKRLIRLTKRMELLRLAIKTGKEAGNNNIYMKITSQGDHVIEMFHSLAQYEEQLKKEEEQKHQPSIIGNNNIIGSKISNSSINQSSFDNLRDTYIPSANIINEPKSKGESVSMEKIFNWIVGLAGILGALIGTLQYLSSKP